MRGGGLWLRLRISRRRLWRGRGGADGETAEETQVPYLIISHAGVAAEGFRKVSGEFAGWLFGIPRYGEESGEASVLDGVDGTGGDDGS